MTRFLIPLLLICASVALFIVFVNPTYTEVGELRQQQQAYDEALVNSRKLLEKRNQLSEVYNSFSTEDRDRLMKLMPDNVDNIRLIIDIQRVAAKYGMIPRDIKFDAVTRSAANTTSVTPDQVNQAKRDYGSFDLEFALIGTYENFVAFVRDLEKSLRIVDISSVTFGVEEGKTALHFTIKTKTYWLKN